MDMIILTLIAFEMIEHPPSTKWIADDIQEATTTAGIFEIVAT